MSVLRPELWTSNANEAIHISLVRANGETVGTFQPSFTYPIFGEAERIYGYKNLDINLKLGASNLLPLLTVAYDDKLKDKELLANVIREDKRKNPQQEEEEEEEEECNDKGPEATLRKFLPSDTFNDAKTWLEQLQKNSFAPPGELVNSYVQNDSTFEIWKAPLSDLNQKTLHERMQIFVLLFIEGGSYIDATDDRWRVYTLYEKSKDGAYTFIGFCTVYSYLWYKDAQTHDTTKLDDDASGFFQLYQRKRISQFVILPLFQGQRHGPRLYNAMMDEFYNDPMVMEVTVEDPNVAFDDMRDRCDVERLDRLGIFADDGFTDAPVSKEWLAKMQAKTKIIPRQFLRCVELALLRRLDRRNRDAYRQYRLQVKQRLYKHNREALKDLDKWQRIDKLNETYKSVELDYYRLLEGIPAPAVEEQPLSKGKGKRRAGSDEDLSKRQKLE